MNYKYLSSAAFELSTFCLSFYIGYREGKGIETSKEIEYITKYAPTIISLIATPTLLKLKNAMSKKINKEVAKKLHDGTLYVKLEDGTNEMYSKLTKEAKLRLRPKIVKNIQNLEEKLNTQIYFKPTLIAVSKTAVESTLGYIAGLVYSYIF